MKRRTIGRPRGERVIPRTFKLSAGAVLYLDTIAEKQMYIDDLLLKEFKKNSTTIRYDNNKLTLLNGHDGVCRLICEGNVIAQGGREELLQIAKDRFTDIKK